MNSPPICQYFWRVGPLELESQLIQAEGAPLCTFAQFLYSLASFDFGWRTETGVFAS